MESSMYLWRVYSSITVNWLRNFVISWINQWLRNYASSCCVSRRFLFNDCPPFLDFFWLLRSFSVNMIEIFMSESLKLPFTSTRGTIYILSLIMKISNLSSKWLYCFSEYSPLWSIHFCMRSNISWAFVCTKRILHLFEFLSNYVGSNENKSFSQLNVHTIFYICWWN